MRNEHKYTLEAIDNGVGTTNGWGYDLFEGGYIKPDDVLEDKFRAQELQEAIDLLKEWKYEMEEDGVLNEC